MKQLAPTFSEEEYTDMKNKIVFYSKVIVVLFLNLFAAFVVAYEIVSYGFFTIVNLVLLTLMIAPVLLYQLLLKRNLETQIRKESVHKMEIMPSPRRYIGNCSMDCGKTWPSPGPDVICLNCGSSIIK